MPSAETKSALHSKAAKITEIVNGRVNFFIHQVAVLHSFNSGESKQTLSA
jgi:hypothetical protein